MDNTRVTDGYSLMHEWDDFVCEMDVTADWVITDFPIFIKIIARVKVNYFFLYPLICL